MRGLVKATHYYATQQAQDAAARQAAYISACVDIDGCYRP